MGSLGMTNRGSSIALLMAGFVLHPWVGLMGVIMSLVLMIPPSLNPGKSRWILLLMALSLLVFAFGPQWLPKTSFDFNPFTPANWPAVNTVPIAKYRELVDRSIASPMLLTALVASFVAIIVSKRPIGTPYALLVIVLVLYFAPFAGAERLELFVPYLVIASMLLASYDIIHFVTSTLGMRSAARYFPPLALAFLLVFVQSRGGYFNEFLQRQRFTGSNGGVATSFSPAERNAADTLNAVVNGYALLIDPRAPGFAAALDSLSSSSLGNQSIRPSLQSQLTRDRSILISDPDTQNILGALAGLRTLGGGPFASDELQDQLRSILENPMKESMVADLKELAANTYQEEPEEIIVTYSGRTERWLQGESRVYQPWDVANIERISDLKAVDSAAILVDNQSLLVLVAR